MRVHFIQNAESEIAFFPDSLRYFSVNLFTKNLITSILQGDSQMEVEQTYQLRSEEYENFSRQLMDVATPIPHLDAEHMSKKMLDRLVLNISNDCNLRCQYCYADGGTYQGDASLMSIEVALAGLRHAMQHYEEIRLIQLFGGEPFLNLPVVEAIAQKAEEWFPESNLQKKPAIGLVTNGTICTDKVLSLIKEHQLVVTVSLDGPKIVNDQMRVFPDGRGVYDLVAANIKRMREETGQPALIEVTYHKGHAEAGISVMEIVHFFKDTFGQDLRIHIVPVDCTPDSAAALADYGAFIASVDEMFQWGQGTPTATYMSLEGYIEILNGKKSTCMLCSAGINTLAISADGGIYPCFMFVNRDEFRMGSVLSEDPFTTSSFIRIQKPFRNFAKDASEPCRSCFINRLCKGCYWRNELFTGNLFDFPAEHCEMNRQMIERLVVNMTQLQEKS